MDPVELCEQNKRLLAAVYGERNRHAATQLTVVRLERRIETLKRALTALIGEVAALVRTAGQSRSADALRTATEVAYAPERSPIPTTFLVVAKPIGEAPDVTVFHDEALAYEFFDRVSQHTESYLTRVVIGPRDSMRTTP